MAGLLHICSSQPLVGSRSLDHAALEPGRSLPLDSGICSNRLLYRLVMNRRLGHIRGAQAMLNGVALPQLLGIGSVGLR
jgi:hypothetical protein